MTLPPRLASQLDQVHAATRDLIEAEGVVIDAATAAFVLRLLASDAAVSTDPDAVLFTLGFLLSVAEPLGCADIAASAARLIGGGR